MGQDAPGQRPERMSIVAISSGDFIEAQYNPTELEENLGAVYATQTVPGLSHQVLQFTHTENLTLTFDLNYDALTNPSSFDADDALNGRRFLHSLCYPRAGAATVRDGAPSRAVFIWPELYTLTAVLTKLKIKFTRFLVTGKPSAFVASCTLQEIRDVRITAEEIMADGTQRADSGGTLGGG